MDAARWSTGLAACRRQPRAVAARRLLLRTAPPTWSGDPPVPPFSTPAGVQRRWERCSGPTPPAEGFAQCSHCALWSHITAITAECAPSLSCSTQQGQPCEAQETAHRQSIEVTPLSGEDTFLDKHQDDLKTAQGAGTLLNTRRCAGCWLRLCQSQPTLSTLVAVSGCHSNGMGPQASLGRGQRAHKTRGLPLGATVKPKAPAGLGHHSRRSQRQPPGWHS